MAELDLLNSLFLTMVKIVFQKKIGIVLYFIRMKYSYFISALKNTVFLISTWHYIDECSSEVIDKDIHNIE